MDNMLRFLFQCEKPFLGNRHFTFHTFDFIFYILHFLFSVREAFPWKSALRTERPCLLWDSLPPGTYFSIHHHISVVWSLNNLYHSCLGTCAKCATKLSRPTYSLPSIRSVMYDENLCKAGRKYKKPKSIKLADLKAKIMSVTFENGSKHSLKELHASFLSGSDSNFSCCPWFLPHTVTHQINSF